MYLQEIPEGIFTTTLVQIRYDCDGGFERCGKEWTLKYKDAKKNFEKHGKKHVCRQCDLKNNNPASNPEVREKMKKTCLERYGTECALNTAENIADRVEQMFGSEESVQLIVEKRRVTSRKRYGTDHPMQTEDVKARVRAVFQDKYGVDAPLQNAEIKAKMQKTNMERYGVANVASSPAVRVKMAQTTLDRYGVEHYNQLPEMKEYLRANCPQWLKESWESGGPNMGITRPEEWNQKQRETVVQLVLDGKWKSGPKNCLRGYYRSKKCKKPNPMFRSSYELRVHVFLDRSDDVEFYDYEPFAITYKDQCGIDKWYIPDFVVKYNGELKLEIVEVKPNYLIGSDDVEFKKIGADALAADHPNLTYNIWGTKMIEEFGFDLDELLELDEVTLL